MKKLILTAVVIAALSSNIIAKNTKDSSSSKDNSSEWKEVGNQGKKALKETGNFFKDLGKKIGSDVKDAAGEVKDAAENANEVKCIGKWGFNKNTSVPATHTLLYTPSFCQGFQVAPHLRPAASTIRKPALWRVRSYSGPGFPRPTKRYCIHYFLAASVPLVRFPSSSFLPLVEELSG